MLLEHLSASILESLGAVEMANCEADDVKPILQIAAEDTAFDAELEMCIDSADAWIDKKLEVHDLSVPAEVPQLIKDASVHFAAWLFRKRRDPTGADAFKAEAEEFLDIYIEDEAEVVFSVVNDQ